MAAERDDVVPSEELLTGDVALALGWAVSTEQPLAVAIRDRVRSGGHRVTRAEVDAVRAAWEAAGRPVNQRHIHRTPVRIADGATVTGVTFLGDDPYGRESAPSFGLYLDERWAPPWPHAHVDWPDFGVPADADALRTALDDLLARARGGEVVEVGCLGGHGRTGTALACLAVLAGTPADDAVAWVRSTYCKGAVETEEQEAFVRSFGR